MFVFVFEPMFMNYFLLPKALFSIDSDIYYEESDSFLELFPIFKSRKGVIVI